MWKKLYKNAACGIRTRANMRGNMTEILNVSTALFFHIIKHAKSKQLKLVLDFTCNNIFTQQFGTITAIILKKIQTSFYDILCSSVVVTEPKMVNTIERAHRVF